MPIVAVAEPRNFNLRKQRQKFNFIIKSSNKAMAKIAKPKKEKKSKSILFKNYTVY